MIRFGFLFLFFISTSLFGQGFLNKNWSVFNKTNSPLLTNNVTAVAVDSSGNYWFGCSAEGSRRGGISVFTGSKWINFDSSNSPIPGNNIQFIYCGINNNVYAATFNGLFHFDGSVWHNYNTLNSGITSNQLTSVSVDASGNVWIGTYQNGIVVKSGNTWTPYNTSNSILCSNQINFVFTDDLNTKWIGSQFGCLNSFTTSMARNGKGLFTPSLMLDINDLKKDKSGYYWISGYLSKGILARFKDTTWVFFDSVQIGSNPIYSYNGIAVDKKNNKFFTARDGMYLYNNTAWAKYHSGNSPVPASYFREIAVDKKNNKLISLRDFTTSYGVYIFNEDSVNTITGNRDFNVIPYSAELYQNYPNPFNPSTIIKFSVGAVSHVTLNVYDVLGKEAAVLVNETKHPGNYEVSFNPSDYNLTSGVYFYKLTAGSYTSVKKMLFVK